MAVILIAEDEQDMQKIIVDFLKRGGHTCITADDGIDAVTILKNHPVDLAVLDYYNIQLSVPNGQYYLF